MRGFFKLKTKQGPHAWRTKSWLADVDVGNQLPQFLDEVDKILTSVALIASSSYNVQVNAIALVVSWPLGHLLCHRLSCSLGC